MVNTIAHRTRKARAAIAEGLIGFRLETCRRCYGDFLIPTNGGIKAKPGLCGRCSKFVESKRYKMMRMAGTS